MNFEDDISRKTIAVVGASGYIGTSLVSRIEKSKARIIRVSRRPLSPKKNVDDWTLNICNKSSWDRIVKEADIIIHLAGNTSVYHAEKDYQNSLSSTLIPIMHLIESSRKLKKIPRVVFASTATVYGLKHNFPVSEKSKPDPATTYDLHKLFAEQQLSLASRQNIVSAVSLRLANVYGPSLSESGSNDRGILNKVVRSSLKGLDISIYGGGNLVRDYVYIDDIINAFLLASTVSHDISGEFNVASGVGTTLKDAFKLVISQVKLQTNSSSKIIFTEWPDSISPIEKRNFVGSIDRICKMINWKPSISLAEGLKRTVSHYARTRL